MKQVILGLSFLLITLPTWAEDAGSAAPERDASDWIDRIDRHDPKERAEARKALIAIGRDSVAPLRPLVKEDDVKLVAEALLVLAEIGEDALPAAEDIEERYLDPECPHVLKMRLYRAYLAITGKALPSPLRVPPPPEGPSERRPRQDRQ